MRKLFDGASAAMALAGVFTTMGCDANPGLYGGFEDGNSGIVNGQTTTLATRDNVIALGTHIPFAESWRFTNPNAVSPANTEELVFADSNANQSGELMELQASAPIFGGSVAHVSSVFALPPGGTSSVYMTQLSNSTVPWIAYPSTCQTLYDPACAQYLHRPPPNSSLPYSFPYAVGNINLTAGQQVRIDTVAKLGVAPSAPGGRWGVTSFVMESGFYQTDPNVIVVPVFVHIFTDNNGNMNNGFMGKLTNSEPGRVDMGNRVRNVFDNYLVNVLNIASATDSSSWHREYKTRLTRAPFDTAAQAQIFDELLLPCNVQVQLQGVDFIRQGSGLDTATIGFGNARSNLPFWDPSDPKMQQNAALMTSYINGMNTVAGVHVFVVGSVNSGDFSSFETAGIGWPQAGTSPGYALVSGQSTSNGSPAGANAVLSHEIGHVLGLRHNAAVGDEIALMFAQTLPASSCSRMHSSAQGLLTPGANH